jgi:ribokinase
MTSTPRARVVVVGSLNRDYVCTVERLPSTGETVLGSELALHDGGKGGNQAVAAALVGAVTGADCALVGAVGDDADGEALLAGLRSAGVDTGTVSALPDVRTGAALITVDGSGANTIVVAPGANHRLEEETVTAALLPLLGAGVVVVLQGELTAALTEAALRQAAQAGARVVLNLAPARPMPDDLLASCDPLVVNESEAAALSGADSGDGADQVVSAALHLGARARSVVVTAGSQGAVVAVDGTTTVVPAPATEVVDSTGAGDAFTGALAVGLAHGHGLLTAVRWGVAVASYSVGHAGAQGSYPRDEACAALLADGES